MTEVIQIADIQPGQTNINLNVRVIKLEITPWQQEKGQNFSGQAGDESGVINFNFRGKHDSVIKEGQVINLRRVNCQVFDSKMRLIDIFNQSTITAGTNDQVGKVNTSNDVSLDEYELLQDEKKRSNQSDERRRPYNNNNNSSNNNSGKRINRSYVNDDRRDDRRSYGGQNRGDRGGDNRGDRGGDNNNRRSGNSQSRGQSRGDRGDRGDRNGDRSFNDRENRSSSRGGDRSFNNNQNKSYSEGSNYRGGDRSQRRGGDRSSSKGRDRNQNRDRRDRNNGSFSSKPRTERNIDENDNKFLKRIAELVPHPEDFITVEAKIQKITENNEKGVRGVLGDASGIVDFYFVKQTIPEGVQLKEGDVVRVVEGKCKVYDEHAYVSVAGGILRKTDSTNITINDSVNISFDSYGKKEINTRNSNSDRYPPKEKKSRSEQTFTSQSGELREPTYLTISQIPQKKFGFNLKAKVIEVNAKENRQRDDGLAFTGRLGDSTGSYDFFFRANQLPNERQQIKVGDVLIVRNGSTRLFNADKRFYIYIDLFGKVLFSNDSVEVNSSATDFSQRRN